MQHMIAKPILRPYNLFEIKFQMKLDLINKIMKRPQINRSMN